MTADIAPITSHWESLGLHFDSIYTGYLGSLEQIQLVLDIFERFGQAPTLKMVDPVMADNGELYAIFPQTFPLEMKRLCAKADLILPNITEACLMLERDYNPGPYTKDYIEGLLQELAALGPRQVVLTGVYFGADDPLAPPPTMRPPAKSAMPPTPELRAIFTARATCLAAPFWVA